MPAALRTDRCLETVDMSAPIISVSSQTQRSPRRASSSTTSSLEGWARALKTAVLARRRGGVLLSMGGIILPFGHFAK
jgi:hypothetical protein